MKKIFFLALTLTFISFVSIGNANAQKLTKQNHYSSVIGKVVDGKGVLVANADKIKKNWASILSSSSRLKIHFESINILTVKGQYYLVGKSAKYHTTLMLSEEGGNIYVARVTGGGISCTSTDCSSTSGCTPTWIGTSCSSCSGDCTKTVSGLYSTLTQ